MLACHRNTPVEQAGKTDELPGLIPKQNIFKNFSYEISAESFNARFGQRPGLYVGKIIPQKYQEC